MLELEGNSEIISPHPFLLEEEAELLRSPAARQCWGLSDAEDFPARTDALRFSLKHQLLRQIYNAEMENTIYKLNLEF